MGKWRNAASRLGQWRHHPRRAFPAPACWQALALCLLSPLAAGEELSLAQAVELALARNPDILVHSARIEAAHGQRRQAAGRFDWLLSSGISYDRAITPLPYLGDPALPGIADDHTRRLMTGYRLGVGRQLRNGIGIDTAFDASSTLDSAEPRPGQRNRIRLDVSLTLPLLKGRGRAAATALEEAADLEVQASRHALRDRAAQTLYQTLLAYWNYRTRVELEQVSISSAERSENLLRSIQKLVDAAEKPRADLVLLRADQADKMAARHAAALARADAQRALGRLLGLDAAAIGRLPAPAQALPAIADITPDWSPHMAAISAAALSQRPDWQAMALRLQAAQRQMGSAQNDLKPQLDLRLGLAYGKASEGGTRYGFVTQAGQVPAQPSVFAQLSLQLPLENNRANGALQERAALVSQLAIQQHDLQTDIASGVDSAWQSLAASARQLRVAQEGLSLYELAVGQEIIKQKNGISTLIDVLNIEARFLNARVNFLQLQLEYASALARLRFETGTFFAAAAPGAPAPDSFTVDMADLAGLGPLAAQFTRPLHGKGF